VADLIVGEVIMGLNGWSVEVIGGETSGNVGLIFRSPASNRGGEVFDRAAADKLVQAITRASYPEGRQ